MSIGDEDLCSGFRESHCDGPTDSAGSACHDGRPAGKLRHGCSSSEFMICIVVSAGSPWRPEAIQ